MLASAELNEYSGYWETCFYLNDEKYSLQLG